MLLPQLRIGEARPLPEVHPGGERAPGASKHECADSGIARCHPDRREQGVEQRIVDRVADLRPVHREQDDLARRPFPLDQKPARR